MATLESPSVAKKPKQTSEIQKSKSTAQSANILRDISPDKQKFDLLSEKWIDGQTNSDLSSGEHELSQKSSPRFLMLQYRSWRTQTVPITPCSGRNVRPEMNPSSNQNDDRQQLLFQWALWRNLPWGETRSQTSWSACSHSASILIQLKDRYI